MTWFFYRWETGFDKIGGDISKQTGKGLWNFSEIKMLLVLHESGWRKSFPRLNSIFWETLALNMCQHVHCICISATYGPPVPNQPSILDVESRYEKNVCWTNLDLCLLEYKESKWRWYGNCGPWWLFWHFGLAEKKLIRRSKGSSYLEKLLSTYKLIPKMSSSPVFSFSHGIYVLGAKGKY